MTHGARAARVRSPELIVLFAPIVSVFQRTYLLSLATVLSLLISRLNLSSKKKSVVILAIFSAMLPKALALHS